MMSHRQLVKRPRTITVLLRYCQSRHRNAGRLDHVLTQLGLVSERGLAEVLAQLIGAPLVGLEFDYEKLGLPADIRLGIERALEQPNGMVLVTGPTGSGKTTTFYTGANNYLES
jgi:hypothetical protein